MTVGPGASIGFSLPRKASVVMDRFDVLAWWTRSDDGQDLLEYAMLCALIALVAVGAVTAVGYQINTVLWQVIAASNI
jgi:Flp pilus assembly pilin Flp